MNTRTACVASALAILCAALPISVYANDDLLRAAARGNLNQVRRQLDEGADIDYRDEVGQTALALAAQNGHVPVVQELINRGAAINVLRTDGRTPLHMAAGSGHTEIVRALIAARAASVW